MEASRGQGSKGSCNHGDQMLEPDCIGAVAMASVVARAAGEHRWREWWQMLPVFDFLGRKGCIGHTRGGRPTGAYHSP